MRLPRSGTAKILVESAPSSGVSAHSVSVGKYGFSAGGGGAWHVQYKYTPGFVGKFGCSAIPNNPRSDEEFTARSIAVFCTAPFTTCLTLPVLFSNTRNSLLPRNAIDVGVVRPVTTACTVKFGSVTLGSCACT